jgi:hypothetical protein
MPLSRRSHVLPAIRPVAPSLRPAPFTHPDSIFEPKYDGFPGLFYLASRLAVFGSKRGNVFPDSGH